MSTERLAGLPGKAFLYLPHALFAPGGMVLRAAMAHYLSRRCFAVDHVVQPGVAWQPVNIPGRSWSEQPFPMTDGSGPE